jgi:hypothetical protein
MTWALNATHSSQIKTHCDSAGLRHPPSMRLRTSCCDLPQNEQNTCSCVVLGDILVAPTPDSNNMSACTNYVKTLIGIPQRMLGKATCVSAPLRSPYLRSPGVTRGVCTGCRFPGLNQQTFRLVLIAS